LEASGWFFIAAPYLIGFLICFIMIGAPVAVALAASSFIFVFLYEVPVDLVASQIMHLFGSEYWIAIPAFILAGTLQRTAGGSKRVWDFFALHLGRSKSALSLSAMITELLYPDFDGDAITLRNDVATARMKDLQEAGFSAKASLRLIAATSATRLISPPSIGLILVGFFAGTSIYEIFLAAIVISVIVYSAAFLSGLIYIRGRVLENWSKNLRPGGVAGVLPWLLAPVIILGIFFMGIVTPSEMAIVAVGCFALLGIVQRSLTIKQAVRASVDTLQRAGSIFLIVLFALVYSRLLVLYGVPYMTASPSLALVEMGMISVLCCLIVGPIAAAVIIGSVFFPAIGESSNPMAGCVAMILGIAIGSIIPPFGPVFAILVRNTKEQFNKLARGTAAFVLPLLLPLMFFIYGMI